MKKMISCLVAAALCFGCTASAFAQAGDPQTPAPQAAASENSSLPGAMPESAVPGADSAMPESSSAAESLPAQSTPAPGSDVGSAAPPADSAPESTPESVPESTPESVPESVPDSVPESTPESAPEGALPEQAGAAVYASDGVGGFVTRLYAEVNGRDPDAEGYNYWCGVLTDGSGWTAAEMLNYFIGSEEYLSRGMSDADFLTAMYNTVFGRVADAGGYAWHLNNLQNGVSRRYVLSVFTGSQEFRDMCTGYGIAAHKIGTLSVSENRDRNPSLTAFVARMYTTVLQRGYDVEGVNYWAGQLLGGAVAGKQMAANFVFSEEFKGKQHSDDAYLRILYAALMGREVDATGFAYWLGQLESGLSREAVFNRFANSPEFLGIMQQYGISTGGPDVQEPPVVNSKTLTVKTEAGVVYTDTVENVLCRVVAGEVGGFRNAEVYKAQAIAAHTWILYQHANGNAAPTVADANPDSFENYGLRAAVREVQNLILTYNGSPALTTYYASSAPFTNAASEVWGGSSTQYPYLTSVESKYDSIGNSGYCVARTFPRADIQRIANYIYGGALMPEVIFNTDPANWLVITRQNPANSLVSSLRYHLTWMRDTNGATMTNPSTSGNYFIENANKALGWYAMRSPNFNLQYNGDDTWTFTFYGWGHGVGMSQWGAYGYNTQEGWGYGQILAHYYPGTVLGPV